MGPAQGTVAEAIAEDRDMRERARDATKELLVEILTRAEIKNIGFAELAEILDDHVDHDLAGGELVLRIGRFVSGLH